MRVEDRVIGRCDSRLAYVTLGFAEGVKENDVIKAAIVLTLQSAPETTKQVLENLQICIKHGSCDLPIKNFK